MTHTSDEIKALVAELRWLKNVTEDDTANVYGRAIDALERLSAENARLREALTNIADEAAPKMHAYPWRDDGMPSKHDKCPHGNWMYENCESCVAEYASAALKDQSNG